jgi:DNA-binding CsgD family transcriptional regulator
MLAEEPQAADRTPDQLPRGALLSALLAIAVLIGIDLLTDFHHGGSTGHLVGEAMIMVVSAWAAWLLWRDRRRARRRAARLALQVEDAQARAASLLAQSEQWRRESEGFRAGLRDAIDAQFQRWGLTAAEAEVALLLLKGLSLKEVARVRDTSERTARQQSLAVYRKAGLGGRAELSAFFLEDLFDAAPAPSQLDRANP